LKPEIGNFPPEADPPWVEKLGKKDSDPGFAKGSAEASSVPISSFQFQRSMNAYKS
jgi:hypothetical protein